MGILACVNAHVRNSVRMESLRAVGESPLQVAACQHLELDGPDSCRDYFAEFL